MNKELKEKIEELIEAAIEDELKYNTDYITNIGWKFLEEEAPKKILENIIEDDLGNDLKEINKSDIQIYLQDIINEYEHSHSNIRYYN